MVNDIPSARKSEFSLIRLGDELHFASQSIHRRRYFSATKHQSPTQRPHIPLSICIELSQSLTLTSPAFNFNHLIWIESKAEYSRSHALIDFYAILHHTTHLKLQNWIKKKKLFALFFSSHSELALVCITRKQKIRVCKVGVWREGKSRVTSTTKQEGPKLCMVCAQPFPEFAFASANTDWFVCARLTGRKGKRLK